MWAPIGERPAALGHHRCKWLHVTAFVQPTSGEAVWFLSNGLSKPLFEGLLASFAQQTGAGRDRRIVLVLDNLGVSRRTDFVRRERKSPGLARPQEPGCAGRHHAGLPAAV
jgi:hypothetical protein